MSSENVTAVATHSLAKTVAPSAKIFLDRACEFIRLINVLSLFVRSWIEDPSLHYLRIACSSAFQELTLHFHYRISKCSPSYITLSKLRLLRRFATDLPTAFILQSLTKYLPNRVNILECIPLETCYQPRTRRSWPRKIRLSAGFFPDQ